jgi:hypothetical protein
LCSLEKKKKLRLNQQDKQIIQAISIQEQQKKSKGKEKESRKRKLQH